MDVLTCHVRCPAQDDYERGHEFGYLAARRGQPFNPTVYKMVRPFRLGYTQGYDDYLMDASRYHNSSEGGDLCQLTQLWHFWRWP